MSEIPSPGSAGYFRIGDVVLSIPPERIRVSRATAAEEMTVLTSRFPFLRRTGRARIDVSLSWRAAVDWTSGEPDYTDWIKLRRIQAMLAAAPFVEVENAHLRQMMSDEVALESHRAMAFALKTLRVQTSQDAIDCLEAELVMSWFEHAPFSQDFRYRAPSAALSKEFQEYLDLWIEHNLENARSRREYPDLAHWRDLAPNVANFYWRDYVFAASGQDPAAMTFPSSRWRPDRPLPTDASKQEIMRNIVDAARSYDIDPALALAIAEHESGFNPAADAGKNGGKGLFQLVLSTARGLQIPEDQVFDPATNIDGAMRLLVSLRQATGNSLDDMLAGYFVGLNAWNRYGKDKPDTAELPYKSQLSGDRSKQMTVAEVREYIRRIRTRMEYFARNLERISAAASSSSSASASAPAAQPAPAPAQSGSDWQEKIVAKAGEFGFNPDYTTSQGIFFFRENQLHLCTEEYSCGSSHPSPNPEGMVPVSFTIIWSNRLAPLPSSGTDLPTFQYCGPMSTLVMIGFSSYGTPDDSGEPVHPGARRLASAVRNLEKQYLAMKPYWKKPSSLHRMQAMLVEAQPLAFFGIYGIMPRMLNTSTVPDSPQALEVLLEAVQWENLYEQVAAEAYKDTEPAAGSPDAALAAAAALLEPASSPIFREAEFADLRRALEKTLQDQIVSGKLNSVVEQSGIVQHLNMAEQARVRQLLGIRENRAPSSSELIHLLRSAGEAESDPVIRELRKKTQTMIFQNLPREQSAGLMSALLERIENKQLLRQKLSLLAGKHYSNPDKAVYQTVYRNAYRHMGLPVEAKIHPAFYFEDEKAAVMSKLRATASVLAESMASSLEQLTSQVLYGIEVRKDGSKAPEPPDLQKSFRDSIPNMKALVEQAVYPSARSMRAAFPVCKVYLVNEESRVPLFRFDDFYGVNTVIGFEIIRYQDKPDMLLLRLSNQLNLLRFRLFDSSIQGKFERENARVFQRPVGASGEPMTGPAAASGAVTVHTSAQGVDRVVVDDLSHSSTVPLQLYPLQTGTKIEVRAGYEDDPDSLPVVFSGIVTAIEDGDILEVTAHGFAIELTVPAPDDVRENRFGVGYPLEVLTRVASGLKSFVSFDFSDGIGMLKDAFDKPPAYGGFRFFGENGDASTVISEMLRVSSARHFGDWKLMVPEGELQPLKGWAQIRLKNVANFFSEDVSRLIGSAYSRRDENILVADRLLFNGARVNLKNEKQRGSYLLAAEGAFFLPAAYYIEDASRVTPWRIIQDIRRRYPTHLLLVKHYGYPFRTEATLVFAHPSDFYYNRIPYPDEWNEVLDAVKAGKTDEPFRQWWTSQGQAQMESLLHGLPDFSSDSAWKDQILRGGMNQFLKITDEYAAIAARRAFMSDLPLIGGTARLIGSIITTPQAVDPGYWRNFQKNIVRIRDEAVAYINRAVKAEGRQPDTARFSSRTRPVRKYFFVNSLDILHNGISLNENVYNTVRVTASHTFCANTGIASCRYSMRILDCRDLIIDTEHNVREQSLEERVAQSFLREELGKMYQGELLLRGAAEIEPGDVVFLDDYVNDMRGPVVVDSVIHQFDAESGFVTIIRPAAFVAVNDMSCLGVFQSMPDLFSYLREFGSFELAQLQAGFADRGTRVAGREATSYGQRSDVERGFFSVTAGLAAGATTAVGIAAGPAALTALGVAGTTTALLGSAAVVLGVPVFLMASFFDSRSPVFLVPLSRAGYPWVAGIDGWEMQSIARSLWSRWDRFFSMEIGPYVDSFNVLRQLLSSR